MLSGLARVVLLSAVGILLCEAVGIALLRFARTLFSEPIWDTSTIYAEQSRQIAEMLHLHAHDPNAIRDVVDPALGWRYRSDYQGDGETICAQGLRGPRIYSQTPGVGRLRVAAFGDSFVYADDVRDEEADAERYNSASEALHVTIALFRAFAERARTNGQVPVLLMLPLWQELERALAGKRTRVDHMVAAAEGIADILDATIAFRERALVGEIAALFSPGGHYSPRANRIVGEWVAADLVRRHAASAR